ncbi:MAG TPA: PAS domain S-box protein [Pseudomonadales bacterium]
MSVSRPQASDAGPGAAETTALLAAIIDSSDDAIISKALDGTISSWNNGAERLFGWSAAEAVGQPITLIIPPELRDEERSILGRLRRGEKVEHFETVRMARDGRRIHISLTISPVRNGDGHIIGASKIARDISERRRAEAALRESERHLRAVIDALPAAVYTTDAEGRVTHFNPAAAELAGRVPRIGRDRWCVSWKLYGPGDTPLPHDRCPMARALRTGQAIHGEEILVERPDGTRAWAAAYPTPLFDRTGRLTGAINMLVDITERKGGEEALRDQTRIAETLNRVGSALAAELDLERIVQFVTDEVTAVTGAELGAFIECQPDGSRGGLYALSGVSTASVEDAAMLRSTPPFAAALAGETPLRCDDVTRDARFGDMAPGRPEVRSFLAVPVVSRADEVLGALLLAHSGVGAFTKRHERLVSGIAAQAAIAIDNARLYARVQESEQRFRQLAERITDVFWLRDVENRRVLYVSPAYETAWGRSVESLYADPQSFLEAVHPDDRARVHEWMMRHTQGEITGEEYRLVHPDGTVRWIWDRGYPIRDESGRLIRIAGVAEDVTERRLAENRLRESEERYRRLTELLPVAVYTCEAPSGAITYFNGNAVELWGRTPALNDPAERFCGSVKLFTPDGTLLPHDRSPMAEALGEGRSFRNREVVIERPDGSRITAIMNIEPIRDAAGRVVAAINAGLDVTALKRAEERLKEADRRKDEFLATLSHELRNPLAPLRHALEIVKRSPNDDVMLRDARDAMERQVGQMARLIDDLLDVSRITHDKLTLRRERISLAEVVHQAVETTRPAIETPRHALTVRLPEEPVWLQADPVRLAQVLGNLLSNAAKYMAPGGCVTLRAERQRDEVEITVRDQGEGIPADQLEQIFEMFAQADCSLDRSRGGLGIGLTLVKRLVEMHGGSVRAESDGPGTGSTFVVRLPTVGAAPRAAEPEAPPARRAGAGASHRVLVVDDNRDSAASLATLLRLTGHATETAFDGAEAIEAAARFRPSVILLDLGLPRLSGYEVCREIRRRAWGRDIAMIAVTGWGQEQDRQRSREAGFDEHLVKPVDLAAIENLLAEVPERRVTADSGR